MKKVLTWILIAVMCLSVFAGCGTNNNGNTQTTAAEGETLEDAKAYLFEMYKKEATATPADYTRVSAIKIGDSKFTVTWKANVTAGQATDIVITAGDLETTIDVNEKSATEIAYTLTAVIADAAGNTIEQAFERTVPAFKVLGWDEFLAAAKGDSVVVKGVITGIISKTNGASNNCLYIQDANGAYYAYKMEKDPIADQNLKTGMTVQITGTKDIYSGTLEIASPVVEIVDEKTTVPAAADYTEIFKKAATLKDEALVAKQAMLVTIKGVEIVAQKDTDTASGYYKFKLGDKESYIRISGSTCPLTKDEQTKFIADHASHAGWTAEATGVICVYDGAFYLTPVTADAFKYVSQPEKSDAEKVATEKEALSIPKMIIASGDTTLTTAGKTFNTVAITWTSNDAAAVIADGKLKVTMPAEDKTVKITATLKLGTVTETKEFEVKLVSKRTVVDVPGALAALKTFADGQISTDLYTVTGVVSSSSYNEKYKSYTIWLTDGTTEKAFELYSVGMAAGVDKDEYHAADALKGKTVTCTGFLQHYVSSAGAVTEEMPYLAAAKNATGVNFTPAISEVK